jgi:hypothetical protein
MTRPVSPSDGLDRLNRRDLLRLGAASAGVPLIARRSTHLKAGGQPISTDPGAAPVVEAPSLPGEDDAEARARTVDNLKILGIAVSGFAHANDGRFPPAAIRKDGKPLLSWRVAILPFLDQKALYGKFHLDEPWDSPHNKALLKEMPSQYEAVVRKDPTPYSTYYQAFVGPGALFDGMEGTSVTDVTDGVGWTLMVAEGADPVPWTKPEDLPYHEGRPLPKLGGQFEDGFYVAFADGSARFLSRTVTAETLRALILRGDGEALTFGRLGPWRRVG